jgi:hypothetical protein
MAKESADPVPMEQDPEEQREVPEQPSDAAAAVTGVAAAAFGLNCRVSVLWKAARRGLAPARGPVRSGFKLTQTEVAHGRPLTSDLWPLVTGGCNRWSVRRADRAVPHGARLPVQRLARHDCGGLGKKERISD